VSAAPLAALPDAAQPGAPSQSSCQSFLLGVARYLIEIELKYLKRVFWSDIDVIKIYAIQLDCMQRSEADGTPDQRVFKRSGHPVRVKKTRQRKNLELRF
jgi:hypothetical protein